jgi:hypothetical protein
LKQYAAAKALVWHGYLEMSTEHGLLKAFPISRRFQGRICVDARGNVFFPHDDEEALCGFEKRNRNFEGFADLGKKGLWMLNMSDADQRLMIGENLGGGWMLISAGCFFDCENLLHDRIGLIEGYI